MSAAHPKKETKTNLTSTPVYPPLLHATLLPVTHPKKQRQTLTLTPFYLAFLYATHTSRYPTTGAGTNKPPHLYIFKIKQLSV